MADNNGKKWTGTGSALKKSSLPSRKEVLDARKGMLALRKEFEIKRKKLLSQSKKMKKLSRTQEMPEWVQEAHGLYAQQDYSFLDMLKLLRKHKIL